MKEKLDKESKSLYIEQIEFNDDNLVVKYADKTTLEVDKTIENYQKISDEMKVQAADKVEMYEEGTYHPY